MNEHTKYVAIICEKRFWRMICLENKRTESEYLEGKFEHEGTVYLNIKHPDKLRGRQWLRVYYFYSIDLGDVVSRADKMNIPHYDLVEFEKIENNGLRAWDGINRISEDRL